MNLAGAINLVFSAIGTRHDTAHDYTDPYGAQCLAFIAWYTEKLGYGSIMPGYNAIDVLRLNPLGLEKPTTPQPGDIFFQDVWFKGINYGHTGVVTRVTANGVYAVAQNARNSSLSVGSPASEDFYPFSTIAGYLRPKFKEEDMIFTKEQYLVAAESVGTQLGKDFNYAADRSMDEFVQLFESQAPTITQEMEHSLADRITGVPSVIGKDYNSQFVGKKIATYYPKMVDFWLEQASATPKNSMQSAIILNPGIYQVKG